MTIVSRKQPHVAGFFNGHESENNADTNTQQTPSASAEIAPQMTDASPCPAVIGSSWLPSQFWPMSALPAKRTGIISKWSLPNRHSHTHTLASLLLNNRRNHTDVSASVTANNKAEWQWMLGAIWLWRSLGCQEAPRLMSPSTTSNKWVTGARAEED